MGPFELMDLVGVDTGFEVACSFYELSYGEPRWRPSPISARYVAAGLHGRKSGQGYYDYAGLGEGGSYREPDPPALPPPEGAGEGVLVISGAGPLAGELRAAASAAGYEVRSPHQPHGGVLPSLIIECDRLPAGAQDAGVGEAADRGAARMVLCAEGSLSALDPRGSAVGFHVLPPFGDAGLVELTRAESSSPLAAERAERLLREPRQARRLGRRCARAGARADRLPVDQRVRPSRWAKASAPPRTSTPGCCSA